MKRLLFLVLIVSLAAVHLPVEAKKKDAPEKPAKKLTMLEKAKKGDSEAQYMMGVCHINGFGVEQDSQAAAGWFGRAAAQGHETAVRALEDMGRGQGGEPVGGNNEKGGQQDGDK